MPNLKKSIFYTVITLLSMSGCTQLITAPIGLVGSVASTSIDVAGSAVGAVIPDKE